MPGRVLVPEKLHRFRPAWNLLNLIQDEHGWLLFTLKWKVFLSLLYTTGLRLEEACNLTWSDVDYDNGILIVSAKRDRKLIVPWEPKDHEIRRIPMSREMASLLAEWRS